MSASVAEVTLIGNVTRDPEVREAGSTRACNLTIAHNTKYKDKEHVSFIDIVLFGKLADVAGEYVRKGQLIYVQGELREEKWEDKETGKNRSKLKVIAARMRMLGGGKGDRARPTTDAEDDREYGNPADSSGAPF
jgi:single-strand DNA-binding protein